MSGALAADPLQAAALSALDSCCRGACSSPVPVLTAGTRTLLHQQLPGTGWERADNCPAANPAQPIEKQHCRPSIATPNAHVAGQDHSSMLFCESSASSQRQECSAWAEASGSGGTRPSGLAASDTSLYQALQRASFLIVEHLK